MIINKLSNKKLPFFFFLFVIVFLLQSCATGKDFIGYKEINNWLLDGKIGIVYPDINCIGNDCKIKRNQGGIIWIQKNNNYNIKIKDPFGRIVITLVGNKKKLTVKSPLKKAIVTVPQKFANLIMGSPPSYSALSQLSPEDIKYWVTGRANPNYPVVKNNKEFSQKGFIITARQWRLTDVGNVPSLVIIKKENLTIRVVIKKWNSIEN